MSDLSYIQNSYDWQEVFKYAEGPEVFDDVSPSGFTLQDVVEVIAYEDGENDEKSWVGIFLLKDGRVAYVSAGCDYTGWG